MSPASFGPSWILYSAASARTWASENSGPPGSAQVAEGDVAQAVAGGADLPVDLEAALELGPVEVAERPLEAPLELRRDRGLAGSEGRSREAEKGGGDEKSTLHHDLFPRRSHQPLDCGSALAPAGIASPALLHAHDGFEDRIRQRQRTLDEAEHRQDDQEVGEVVDRADLRGDHVPALGRAASRASRARRRRPRRPRRTACRAGDRPWSAPSRCRARA